MDKIVTTNTRKLLDLIECLYYSNDIDNLSQALFSSLEELLAFRSASLVLIDEQTYEMVDVIGYRFNPESLEHYRNNFTANNVPLHSVPCPTKINKAAIFSLENTPYKQRLSKPKESYCALSVISGWYDHPVAIIHLHRDSHENSFTIEDAKLFNYIAPHIAQAITLNPKLSKIDPHRAPGILTYTADGRLLFQNQRSKELLPNFSPDEILAIASQPNHATKQQLDCHLHSFPLRPSSFLYWLNRTNSGALTDSAQNVTVVVAQQRQLRSTIEKQLQHSKLSPREFDVALATIQGLSNAEIASQLCIDTKTVKDHLSKVYLKMSVRSRTALISRVLNLDVELAGLIGNRNKARQQAKLTLR